MKLREIDEQLEELREAFDKHAFENDGEIDESIDEKITALEINRNDKIDGVATWYKELVAEAKAVDDEAKALAKRSKSVKAKAERLKAWVEYALAGESLKTAQTVIAYRKSEQVAIMCLDASEIDDAYTVTKTSTVADKTAIKKAIKSGVDVAGCELVVKQNMSIK